MCWDGDLRSDDHDSIKEPMIKACIPCILTRICLCELLQIEDQVFMHQAQQVRKFDLEIFPKLLL